jgi:putative flippase GtrA
MASDKSAGAPSRTQWERACLLRLARFGAVGLSGVAVNTAALWLLVRRAGLPLTAASAIATEIAILSNFALNDAWTFRHAPRASGLLRRLLRFNAVSLGGLSLTVTALFLLNRSGLPLLPANAIAVGCAVAWNYLANSRWTWRVTSAPSTPGTAQPPAGIAQKELQVTTALHPPAPAQQRARSHAGYRPTRKHRSDQPHPRRPALVAVRGATSDIAVARWAWLLLGGALLLGAALRFGTLGAESLWNDELSSWKRSLYDNVAQVTAKSAYSDFHPPGFQIVLFYVMKLLGDSEVALRLPSAIAGVLSIGMIFMLGRRLYSWREGLLAAGLLAVCRTPIYYSQEARSYSLLLLFALITTYVWIDLMRRLRSEEDDVPLSAAFAYIAPAVFCCYLHYYGLFLVALQGLCALIVFRRRFALLRVVFVYVLVGMAYMPWVSKMLVHAAKQPSAAFVSPNLFTFGFFMEFLFNKTLLVPVLLIYGFLVVYALVAALRDRRLRRPYLDLLSSDVWLAFWLVVPFTIVFAKSAVSSPIFTNRNMIIALPAAYLLAARGTLLLPVWRWGRGILAVALVTASLYDLVATRYYVAPQKEQFREAVQYVAEQNARAGSSLVIGYAWEPDYFNYYFERSDSPLRVHVNAGAASDTAAFMDAVERSRSPYVWYITGHKQADDAFVAFLMDHFTVVEYQRFNRTRVWLLRDDQMLVAGGER